MKVIQDLAALYSALLLLTGESGQVGVEITENIIERMFLVQKMLKRLKIFILSKSIDHFHPRQEAEMKLAYTCLTLFNLFNRFDFSFCVDRYL